MIDSKDVFFYNICKRNFEAEMTTVILYIIRHGDPIYDPDSLTPKGHRQAEAVGRRLSNVGISKIYSSPMIRAQQTAKPLAEMMHLDINIEEWASEDTAYREMSMDYHGQICWYWRLPVEEYVNDSTVKDHDNWYDMPSLEGHGESIKKGMERILACSDEFIARHGYRREGTLYRIENPNDDRIAMFCHEGFSKAWVAQLLGIAPHVFAASFDVTHSGIIIIEFPNNENGITRPRCLAWSDTSHIYEERLPMTFMNGFYI